MTIKVETISVDEATRRVANVYVGKEAQLKDDLNKALNHAQVRAISESTSETSVDSGVQKNTSKKLGK